MIRNILYAADLGIYTPYMLQHVLTLATHYRARVTILHVVEPMSLIANAVVKEYMPQHIQQQLQHGGLERILRGIRTRIVAALADDLIDGNQGLRNINDVRVVCGKPADVILSEAAHIGADLIVLGRSGHRRGAESVLGSVASRVLQRARVPVYMVPMASAPGVNDVDPIPAMRHARGGGGHG